MTIRDVTKATGLTRKAVEYYEQMALITPGRTDSGYRLYDEKAVATLREIALLRRLGLDVAEIREVLDAPDKTARLREVEIHMAIEEDRRALQRKGLSRLIASGYNVPATADYMSGEIDALSPIRERLLISFPGGYGLYLHLHFGRFLTGRVDSPEKQAAFDAIVGFLDSAAALDIPPEIETVTRTAYEAMRHIPGGSAALIEKAVEDIDGFLAENRETMEAYIAFRTSDDYAQSEAGRMQKLLLDFQSQMGYQEVFLPNMRLLSDSYSDYMTRMEAANARLLSHYPELGSIYPEN